MNNQTATSIPFDTGKSIEILERTPDVLIALLTGVSDAWIYNNEGEETFSPYDVVGHLLHGETTDWVARMNKILATEGNKTFDSFDRFAMYEESKGKSLNTLLEEFKEARMKNLEVLKSLQVNDEMLDKTGIHPKFGEVTLRQLLSTWTAHDLGHIGQIVRVMAKQYKNDVGPWIEFLRILKD